MPYPVVPPQLPPPAAVVMAQPTATPANRVDDTATLGTAADLSSPRSIQTLAPETEPFTVEFSPHSVTQQPQTGTQTQRLVQTQTDNPLGDFFNDPIDGDTSSPVLDFPTAPDVPIDPIEPIEGDLAPEDLDLDPIEASDPEDEEEVEDLDMIELADRLNLRADRLEGDEEQQVLYAEGNVQVDLPNSRLTADRVWINLSNRFSRAEGDVMIIQGSQVVRGEQAEFNLVQGQGIMFQARGEVFLPTLEQDFAEPLSTDVAAGRNRTIGDRLRFNEPQDDVRSVGSVSARLDTGRLPGGGGGGLGRLRFEADRLEFDATGWVAENIRLTNDPFSPPELEFRSDQARLSSTGPGETELFVPNARIVFDQNFTLPLFRDRIVFREGDDAINPLPFNIGYDEEERGGLFVEPLIPPTRLGPLQVQVTPQLLVQRFFSTGDSDPLKPSNYGLRVAVDGALGPRTRLSSITRLSSLDFDETESALRTNTRLTQGLGRHTLSLEHNYRDRLFNGTLGFQRVQQNFGAVLTSPAFTLGDSGVQLSYQLSAQYINANTDRPELQNANNRTSLGRSQGTVALSRRFPIWQGETLPPTAEEGLRYTPTPVRPYFQFITGVRGTTSYYTNGDFQNVLTGTVGLEGQLGRFSRPVLDYTRFNLRYSGALVGGTESPFLFDRARDNNVVSFGIIQQLYGPFLIGVQTSINVNLGRATNTEYSLEYSRRTYGIAARYNPTRSTGFIGFRLSNFDWTGSSDEFGPTGIRQVDGGVIR